MRIYTTLRSFTQTLAIMRIIVALAIGLLLSSCKPSKHAEFACTELTGLPSGKLLLLGEMHGTVESPRIAGVIACHRAKSGPTALGLEVPVTEQPSINTYLRSKGDHQAQQTLLAGPFWQRSKDGRSSEAMLGLIEYARQLKSAGLPLSVFAFDSQINFPSDRNTLLASTIRQYHLKHPGESIVALMGSAHAGKESFTTGETIITPSGKQLEDIAPTSIMLAYTTGSIWACMPDCKIHSISSDWALEKPVGFVQGAPIGGYEFSYILPSLTASPPASDDAANG